MFGKGIAEQGRSAHLLGPGQDELDADGVLVLREAGVTLGATYPEPVVDLKASRERALAAFKSLSSPSS